MICAATDTPKSKEDITVLGEMTAPLPSAELSGELRPLWTECFPSSDSAEDADRFCRLSDASTMLWRVDGAAAGMCNLVPVSAGELQGLYLFAVGVRPGLRGMGGFRALCRAAAERASGDKLDFLCLVPATEALDATYRRFGYGGNGKIPRWKISAEYAAALTPATDIPLPRDVNDSTVMPSAGFLKYLRSSYHEMCLGKSILLCGDERDGGRAVYEYIPCPGDPCPPTPEDSGFYGLALPLTARAERLLDDGISFYSTMGED